MNAFHFSQRIKTISIINYAATGANKLKNWHLLSRSGDDKLPHNDDEHIWPFHKMFFNHIKNIEWNHIMVYNFKTVPTALSTRFVEVENISFETSRSYQSTRR